MLKMLNFTMAYCLLKLIVYICTHITIIKLNNMENLKNNIFAAENGYAL